MLIPANKELKTSEMLILANALQSSEMVNIATKELHSSCAKEVDVIFNFEEVFQKRFPSFRWDQYLSGETASFQRTPQFDKELLNWGKLNIFDNDCFDVIGDFLRLVASAINKSGTFTKRLAENHHSKRLAKRARDEFTGGIRIGPTLVRLVTVILVLVEIFKLLAQVLYEIPRWTGIVTICRFIRDLYRNPNQFPEINYPPKNPYTPRTAEQQREIDRELRRAARLRSREEAERRNPGSFEKIMLNEREDAAFMNPDDWPEIIPGTTGARHELTPDDRKRYRIKRKINADAMKKRIRENDPTLANEDPDLKNVVLMLGRTKNENEEFRKLHGMDPDEQIDEELLQRTKWRMYGLYHDMLTEDELAEWKKNNRY
jgi:hypothetical protein